jgi:hypothetical protein
VFSTYRVTGYVGKHVVIDGDLKRRLVTAFDLLTQFGPAWARNAANLYVITPEGAVMMFWPGQPWALQASDWEISGKLALVSDSKDGVFVVGEQQKPPPTHERWSDLYFDYGVNDWVVSVTRPIVAQGRHLISVGHDILLHDLIARAVQTDLNGAYSFLFSEDGRLIAHPIFMDAIQAKGGSLSIRDTKDPSLARVMELAAQRGPDNTLINHEAADDFYAITRLSGRCCRARSRLKRRGTPRGSSCCLASSRFCSRSSSSARPCRLRSRSPCAS